MKVLLLQLKRIGDLILTTPAIVALRTSFPDAHLTLVISSECADLVPALSNVDRVLIARRNLSDVTLFPAIVRRKFNYCIDFTRNDRSAALAFLSRAQRRIVSRRVRKQSKARARAYNEFVDVRMRDLHTIDYHMALLEPLGIRNGPYGLHLQIPEPAHARAECLRRESDVGSRFVIFHPGSARKEKLWDPACWATVIEHAGRNDDLDLVLTSSTSPLEQTHIAAIKSMTRQRLVDLSGKTDLLTLAMLIKQARLLITVDSAPMHLATAMQTPQVILFGPTNPFHWRPRESPAVILQGRATAPMTEFRPVQPRVPMSQISTEAVIGAMNLLLSPHASVPPS